MVNFWKKAKEKSLLVQYIIVAVLIISIISITTYIMFRSDMNANITFAPDYTLTDNPLMGFAPDAGNEKLCEDSRLVSITLTWAEWEPIEGVFDIEAFENKNNIAKWRAENKHAVIRFVCDIPGSDAHKDIPEWLYSKTATGIEYDSELGKGYSPDYADKTFIQYHKKALEELARYCNKDHFVSFVEIGSLGHWGEWHASDGNGIKLMPDATVCSEYLRMYSESFNNAKLLTRRNYEDAVNGKMGVFNDMVGSTESTDEWLGWLKNGGTQETSGKALNLKSSESFGFETPVGGEFRSDIAMKDILGDSIGDTLSKITESHMTFIGPMVPDYTDKEFALAAESVVRRTGYRIYPSQLKTQYDFAKDVLNMNLTFKNAGNAGFFFDWPVTVYVLDKDKNTVFWKGLDLDLRTLDAEKGVTASAEAPINEELRDEFYIGISITDYDGNDSLKLAIDYDEKIEDAGNIQIIYHYKRD